MFSCEIYEIFRSSHRRCFMKKAVLKTFAIFTGKLQACNFIKERLQHMFCSEFCGIFKNAYFEERLLTAASDFLKQLQNSGEQLFFYWLFYGIPEFLGSGHKCWTLDSGRLTLVAGIWTLDAGRWMLWFCLIKLLKIIWVRISKDVMIKLIL